jgi:hypothetical protein
MASRHLLCARVAAQISGDYHNQGRVGFILRAFHLHSVT